MDPESLVLMVISGVTGLSVATVLLLPRAWRATTYRRQLKDARALAENERRFRSLVQHAADAILIVDQTGVLTYISPSAEKLPGLTERVAIGRRFDDLVWHPSTDSFDDLYIYPKHQGVEPVYHELALSADDQLHWYDAAFTNLLNDPAVEGIVINLHSVTARKRAEQAAVAALADAVRAREAEARFLANMSHELRTPLNAIIGFSEIMRDEVMGPLGNPKYQDYTANICLAGNHLLGVINAVLDYSKAEAGGLELEEETVEVDRMLRECQRLMAQQAEAKRIRLNIDWAAGQAVQGDARLLRQAMINLLGNAIKYTPDGGEVTVSFLLDGSGNPVLQVADTGMGMTPEEIPLALSPFGRVRNAKTRHVGGTGLGLAITRHIAEYHGGRLVLGPAAPHGLVAQIVLPKGRLRTYPRKEDLPRSVAGPS